MREPEDEDDQESVLDFPVDKTFNHLVNFIYKQYPDSCPHSDPLVPPCCELVFFAVSVPILIVVTLVQGSAGILLVLYIRKLQRKLRKLCKLRKLRNLLVLTALGYEYPQAVGLP